MRGDAERSLPTGLRMRGGKEEEMGRNLVGPRILRGSYFTLVESEKGEDR